MNPYTTIRGLIWKPSATMWKLREDGTIPMSVATAAVVGAWGWSAGHVLEAATGHTQPLWASVLAGIACAAAMFLVDMLTMHAAAVLQWRAGPSPVMGGRFSTFMRMGGYLGLPSALVGALQWVLIPALHTGSIGLASAVFYAVAGLAIAGTVWSWVFTLRLIRTAYLVTWGGAFAIILIASLLALPLGSARLIQEAETADVGWYLHAALGADPAVVSVLEQLPRLGTAMAGVGSTMPVLRLRNGPAVGDLVAYYQDREAPAFRRRSVLPSPIAIGRVVALGGSDGQVEPAAGIEVASGHVAISPVGSPSSGPVPQIGVVPAANIAGLVPTIAYLLHHGVASMLR